MTRYNHAFTLAFEVSGSRMEDGSDVTVHQMREALLARIAQMDRDNEWTDAVGEPHDTMEEEED